MKEAQPAIEDLALVGDSRSAALIDRDGCLHWLCWPHFDSAPTFWSLVDPAGARWHIAPTAPYRAERHYLEDTNILVTRFETAEGTLRVTDFMPVASEEDKRGLLMPERELLRIVDCEAGSCEIECHGDLDPHYGLRRVVSRRLGERGVRIGRGDRAWLLCSSAEMRLDEKGVHARHRLRAGERVSYSLSYAEEGPLVWVPFGDRVDEALSRTATWWRRWAARARYAGPYREAVIRSSLVLKALTYAPSGAVVAAPTTSLPERPGGALNWDYRYCWIRDAALTVRALLDLGYDEDAHAFVAWLLHATRLTRPKLRVLYDVYGRRPKPERELAQLAGWRGARPVRIGNGAAGQLQLDTYGEVLDALAQIVRRHDVEIDRETARLLDGFGTWTCRHWELPDQGIWEMRGAPQHHTYSKVMCWVALDRLLELVERGRVRLRNRPRFEHNRALIRQRVEDEGYDPVLRSYVQTFRGKGLDASLLQLAWYGYQLPEHPRMRGTYGRVMERLGTTDGLLYRYEQSLPAGEGAFGICSFWVAEYLARGGGSYAQAQRCFERVLSRANDVGLFAEEIDAADGGQLGNFPQAFTHVGLIGAALALEQRRTQSVRGRPQREQKHS